MPRNYACIFVKAFSFFVRTQNFTPEQAVNYLLSGFISTSYFRSCLKDQGIVIPIPYSYGGP